MSSRERSQSVSKRYYSWAYFELLMNRLYDYIKENANEAQTIAAIARGGLLAGKMLSYKLGKDFVAVNGTEHICRENGIIIVEDVVETGYSVCRALDAVHTTDKSKIWVVSLVAKPWSPPVDFFATMTEDWVVWRWEEW